MKKILFSILIVLLSVSFTYGQGRILIMKKKGGCANTLTDSQTTYSTTETMTRWHAWYGSDFTTGSAYTLCKLEIYIYKVGTPTGNGYLKIYSDSSGVPGTLLATSTTTLAESTLSDSAPAFIAFDFEGLALTTSTKYHIVYLGTANSSNYVAGGVNGGATGHTSSYSDDGVSWGPYTANDQINFKTYR